MCFVELSKVMKKKIYMFMNLITKTPWWISSENTKFEVHIKLETLHTEMTQHWQQSYAITQQFGSTGMYWIFRT